MRNLNLGTEDDNQEAIFQWCQIREQIYPELKLLYHVPNEGQRTRSFAAALKRRGVKAGVPDMCLPVHRGRYHGLYIELKVGNNKATDKQKEWLLNLNMQGYKAVICYGWEDAVKMIEGYLKMED